MSHRTAFACDGPGCDVMQPAREGVGSMALRPDGWIELDANRTSWHFHSWRCLQDFVELQAPEIKLGLVLEQ